jgi:outer membrane protein OmpA-like peptidoglycan-associated protein
MKSISTPYRTRLLRILFLLLLLPACTLGQDLSTKSKKAKKAFELAERAFRLYNYQQAEIQFKEAIKSDSGFFEAWVMLGDLYRETEQDSSALYAYQKAVSIDADRYPRLYYSSGMIQYGNGQYAGAELNFERYLRAGAARPETAEKIGRYLENCTFAREALKNPVPFEPVNLGATINTELNEYFPCLTADNQTLLFTRLLDDEASFTGRQEDFFLSTYGENGWALARSVGLPINTVYNEGAPALSADGNRIVFTACESVNGYGGLRAGFGRCDLFSSSWDGYVWSEPENIGRPVNSGAWESQPSLAADGRSIYFVSNRSDNYDIWWTQMDGNGRWKEPQRLDSVINTEGYEGSVFIHPDNQTLYFSSDGHPGMGGMDIYFSRRGPDGQWGPPVNLGYPINTHKDENSILISADGSLAMFASDRETGFGGLDLYAFELYEEARPQFVTYLKGRVFDGETKKRLQARFELTDLETGEVAVRSFSSAGTGEFLVCLPTDRDYALTVEKEGYLFHSENFNLSGVSTTTDPFVKDLPLSRIEIGKSVVLKNIFFETDKYNLQDKSRIELDKVNKLLKNNPGIRIEISGHTDNVGTSGYNLELSRNRAKAVYDYLIESGIAANQLQFKGYGESSPIATNESEQGRAENRRTEMKVVEAGGE